MTMFRLAALSFLVATSASAQPTRTALPAGQVTGLEMTIEGPREVRPGETPRWLIAAHEIHADRDYRPATGISVRMFASIQRDEPVSEATTDAHGRAILEMHVPDDTDGFEILIDARSNERAIRRRFRVWVHALPDRHVTGAAVLSSVRAGGSNALVGELRDGRNLGIQDELEVVIRAAEGGRVLFGPSRVQTTPDGAYAVPFTLPESFLGRAEARVTLPATGSYATTHVEATPPPVREMRVHAAPERRVARPGESVPVTVYVRDDAGRPLRGAIVSGLPHPPEEDPPRAQTDARGRATLPWYVHRSEQRFEDRAANVHVVAPGIGEGVARVTLRVARAEHHAHVIPEGGALIPGVPSRVFVRVLATDGTPRVGQRISIAAPRTGTHAATTDQDGVAILELTLRDEGDAVPDACGGATALALETTVGEESQTLCAPVDPDGTVRVRATTSNEGVQVQLAARDVVRNAPILLSLLRRENERLLPIDQRVLPAGQLQAAWPTVPAGELLVRARPLVGPGLQEVRGGIAFVESAVPTTQLDWLAPASLRAPALTVVAAVPPRLAHALATRWERDAASTDAHWRAQLAMRTPRDESAPAILREGRILPLPAPEDPVAHGVLRDPWRQRARYRTGRLALVIRALERYVASADIADVAMRDRGRWRFNRALLDAILDDPEIGPEGARDLGGLPLGIEALEAMDPSLTFDRMARRITRERLLRAFVLLREQVGERNLDLPFGRRGTPADWIAAFAVDHDETLFRDAWGGALRLAESRRASDFDVIPGWRLESAGPDGRFGNADDVIDLTARVVPSGSLYADAMDEDGLLARLNGVALGRATLDTIAAIFGVEGAMVDHTETRSGAWGELPSLLPPAIDASRLLARGTDVRVLASHSGSIQPQLPSDPADYGLVAMTWEGGRRFARHQHHRHGHGVMLAADWPTRLGRDAWSLEPQIIAFDAIDGARVVASARGAEVRVPNEPIRLAAGASQPIPIRLVGGGGREASVELRVERSGETLWSHRLQLPIHGAAVDRTTWAGAWVGDRWDVDFDLPDEARRARGELVVVAHDRLFEDPLVRRWESTAVRGWAAALVGRLPDASIRASLEVRGGLPAPVEAACALLAWTALSDEEGVAWLPGYQRALRTITSAEIGDTRQASATLAALAPVAGGAPVVTEHDALQRRIDSIREMLWNGMRTHAEEPALMARAAAALLLADPADASGRALFVAARDQLVDHERGGRWLAGDSGEDGLAATAAMVLAANALGDHELQRDLRRALGARAWLGLLREGDAGFWLLAASSYGALGQTRDGRARAMLDGQALELEDGVARHRFTADDDVQLQLRGQGLGLARVRVRYERPIGEVDDGPLELSLEGDVGMARETSALEVMVIANEASDAPELLVQLPPGALLDRASRARIERSEVVRSVAAPDREGVVHIHLQALAAGARVRVPLPVRWSGSGPTRGFALVAYDAATPWATTSVPARDLTLR